jgi:hypothetical protein
MNNMINWAPEEQEMNLAALEQLEAEAQAEVDAARAVLDRALAKQAVVAGWRRDMAAEGAI